MLVGNTECLKLNPVTPTKGPKRSFRIVGWPFCFSVGSGACSDRRLKNKMAKSQADLFGSFTLTHFQDQ